MNIFSRKLTRETLSILLILCLGSIAYSNTFHCSFHLDDGMYILDNLAIRNIHHLFNIWAFYPCRFITFLSLAFNYHFNGVNVFGYHLFNMAVHLVSAILVWWLALLTLSTPVMKGDRIARHAPLIALLAGLVFVSHPLQTEAVTYIWQRTASLATLFYLASLNFYIKSRLLQGNDRMKFYYIGALITALAAMFTKEMTITLPLMILFYEVSFLKTAKNLPWKGLIPFLLMLFIIPLTILFSGADQEKLPVDHISSMHYFLTQLRVMVTYIRLIFLPLHQNLDYDYPIYNNIFELSVLASLFFLLSILFWAQQSFLKYRLVSFSIFWFFLTLLPESSFIPFKDVIFEHRLYLPLVGFSIFLASGAYYLFGEKNIKAMGIAVTILIICNSILTYQRNKIWKDDLILWNETVRQSPHKARPYNNRGLAYIKQGRTTQALSDFNKSIEIFPQFPPAYDNRGHIYGNEGKFTQALSDYNKAIELTYSSDAIAYSDRGVIYDKQGHMTQAIADYNQAIKIDPQYPEAYYNRAVWYYQLRKYDQAWADVYKVEKLKAAVNPEFINALKQATDKAK